jgi:regulatory protein
VLVRKKLPSLRKVDSTTATRRLVGMLARKGYSAGLAFAVVKDELGAAASGDAEADDF